MKMYLQFRQGDVLVDAEQITGLPQGSVPVSNEDRVVLAHGEVTGHAHAVSVADATEFTHTDAGGVVRRFLQVLSGATVKHEEHAAIPLPAGIYEIIAQREYHPEEIRNVAD